jgi:diacylglycerol O-acyltransferase
MDRLSPLDASFLFGEDGRSHMDIGMVLEFDGPPMSRDDVVAAIRGRVPLVPRYRQKVRMVPGAVALPVWIDDVDFDVDRHVFCTRAGDTGDDSALFAAVSDAMSAQLDRGKPLWEVHVITELAADRWAMVVRMHHCMVDGVTSTAIVRVLLSETPDVPQPIQDDWTPAPEPSDWQLVQDAFTDNMTAAAGFARQAATSMLPPAQAPTQMPGALDVEPLVSLGQPVTDPTVNGPVGAGRRFERTRFPLAEVKTVRAAFGGTVNDVLLAVCARAFRELLMERGETVAGRVLRTLVPVAMRSADGAAGANQIAGIPVELPLGDVDVVETLHSIRRQTSTFKKLSEAVPAVEQVSMPGFALPVTLTLGSRMASTLPSLVNTVTSNVPGPQHPLYLHGRELTGLSACIALWAPLRIAVQVLSYNGVLGYAVVSDRDSTPDLSGFIQGAHHGLAELVAAAGGSA